VSSDEVKSRPAVPTWVILLLCLTTIVLGAGLTKRLGFSSPVSPAVKNLGMLLIAIEAVVYAGIAVALGARRVMPVLFAMGMGILCRAAMAGGGAVLLATTGAGIVSAAEVAWLGDGSLLAVHGALVLLCLAFLRPMFAATPAAPGDVAEYEAPMPDVAESLAEFHTTASADADASREELVSELMAPVGEDSSPIGLEQPSEEPPLTCVEPMPAHGEEASAYPEEASTEAVDAAEEAPEFGETSEPIVAEVAEEPAMPYEAPEPYGEVEEEEEVAETPEEPKLDEFPTAPPIAAEPEAEALFSFEMSEEVPETEEAVVETEDAPAEEPEPVFRFSAGGVEEMTAASEEPAAEAVAVEEPLAAPAARLQLDAEPAAEPAGRPLAAPSGQVAVSPDAVLAQFPDGALTLTPEQLEDAFSDKPFTVPLDVVLPQLSGGEVRIPVRVLVDQLPPGSLAVSEVELDAALADGIELPLDEVVPQIPVEHLAVAGTLGAPPEIPEEDIFEVPETVKDFDAAVSVGAEPAPEAPEAAAEPEPAEAPEEVAPGEMVTIGAESVLCQLPAEAFVSSPEDVQGSLPEPVFRVPVEAVLSQLSTGQVVVPTSVITSQLPAGALLMSPDEIDAALPTGGVELPLGEIVPQLEGHIGASQEQAPAPVLDDEPLFTPASAEAEAPASEEVAESTPSPLWETEEAVEEEDVEEPVEAAAEAELEVEEPEPTIDEPAEVEAAEPVTVAEALEPSVEPEEEPEEAVAAEPTIDVVVPEAQPFDVEEPTPVAEAPPEIDEPEVVAEETPAEQPVEEAAPAMAAPSEAMSAIDVAAQQIGALHTDWAELPDGTHFASALAVSEDTEAEREAAMGALAAGRSLCDASERGALNTVLVTGTGGSAALGWAATPGGAGIACQLSAAGTRSPGKVGVATHKLMAALESMDLTGGEPTHTTPAIAEPWELFEGDDNGAHDAERAMAAVKLSGVASQLFVRSDGPRLILLGPQALIGSESVSAAGTLLDAVADYAALIRLGEMEKVIVEGASGAVALMPAQNGKPALVLLAPGSTKAGMVSVQIGKASAALGE